MWCSGAGSLDVSKDWNPAAVGSDLLRVMSRLSFRGAEDALWSYGYLIPALAGK